MILNRKRRNRRFDLEGPFHEAFFGNKKRRKGEGFDPHLGLLRQLNYDPEAVKILRRRRF